MAYTLLLGKMIAFPFLVIIGVTEHGCKELVDVEDAYLESETNLTELLNAIRPRGLTILPGLLRKMMPLIFGMQWQRYSQTRSTNFVCKYTK
ncbi:MAG: hypothetical protein ACTS73_08365 [Arsenophonus sp. NEOnobi-MAG3]